MLCEELMRKNCDTVSPTDSIVDAAKKMRDEDIGFLPVVDKAGKVLGTLTDRDIVVRAIADGREDAKVSDVMSKKVISCSPTDDIQRAEKAMSDNRIVRVVCCDELGRLMGVISFSDLAGWDSDAKRIVSMISNVKEQPQPAR